VAAISWLWHLTPVVTNTRAASNLDSIGALYYTSKNTVYLRLRDGSDPSSLTIRGSPNSDTQVTFQNHRPAVLISSKSYIHLAEPLPARRNSVCSTSLVHQPNHVTIQNNYLKAVPPCGSGFWSPRHVVQNNIFTANFTGTQTTARTRGSGSPYTDRDNVYTICKYVFQAVKPVWMTMLFVRAWERQHYFWQYHANGIGSACG